MYYQTIYLLASIQRQICRQLEETEKGFNFTRSSGTEELKQYLMSRVRPGFHRSRAVFNQSDFVILASTKLRGVEMSK